MNRPEIADAPGLVWKSRKGGRWDARWQARTDLVRRGYGIKSASLWVGVDPNDEQKKFIAARCTELQKWMLDWGGERPPTTPATFEDGLLQTITAC